MRPLLLLVTCALGCSNLYPPPSHACGPGLYVDDASAMPCADAIAAYNWAHDVTGIDMRGIEIYFVHGTIVGHENANGETVGQTIEVVASNPTVLVHELYHARDGQGNHCGWSSPEYLAIFNAGQVPGWYVDECAHLKCTSTRTWYDEKTWQRGDNFVCTPEAQ
jgi:hypothetical protein